MDAVKEVTKELDELKKLSVEVPSKAYEVAKRDAKEFYENGMSITDITDHCIICG